MTTRPNPSTAAAGDPGGRLPVVLVTGMSGAGKSSAYKALEDMGFDAVDNIPLTLLGALIRHGLEAHRNAEGRPLAVVVDIRTRDFGVEPFLAELDTLLAHPKLDVRLLFLDCDDDVLRRRFTETRRRHPLAFDRPVADGIVHERQLVSKLRERANVLLDTTHMALPDFRRTMAEHFTLDQRPGMAIFVTSFAYREGVPREADLVFDVRFLSNPHYVPDLRPLTGRDEAVGAHIAADLGFPAFFEGLTGLLLPLLPRYEAEGKSYLTIAIGCTGGKHRSVYVAERLAESLRAKGQRVQLHHRDLERATAEDTRA